MSSNDSPEGLSKSGPIAWMAANPVASNLIMIILFAGGLWTASYMQKEVEPQFLLDVVEVSVTYPGAAPAEVETGILLPVEEAVRGIQGIKEITSTAREGSGMVTIELVAGSNRTTAFQDIDQAVSRIRTFPEDIEEPEVRLQSEQREVMEVVIYGDVDVWGLRKLAERFRDQLLSDPNITQVELGRAPAYVTHVEIPSDKLLEHELTLGEVADIIEQSSQDIPAGDVQTDAGIILLRMKERKQWADEFRNIQLVSSDAGSVVKLGDIATITDGFEETGFHSQFNQTPSVEVGIFRVGTQSPLDISEAVRSQLESFEASLPPGVNVRVGSSAADDYEDRLNLLLENALMAVIIVLVILALFLEIRLAFWVMMGMSVSFIGALIFLPMVDVSINMISMFGFLVVLGIVVDDAIVVGENIYEYRQRGGGRLGNAIEAAREMATPVTFSILTNIVAFVPLLFIPGTTGKYWWPLPAVVIVVLLVSLFEAVFILPAHLGHHSKTEGSKLEQWLNDKQSVFADAVNRSIERYFGPFLDRCLRYRYITVAAALGLLAVVGSYGYSGHMGLIMMPEVAADEIEAGIRLPVGVTPRAAAKVAEDVTAATQRMFDKHNLYEVADGIKTNVRGGSFVDVEIVMKPPDERDMTAREVIKLWRDEIGDIDGVSQISFEAERGPGGWRQDIEVDLSHNDIGTLEVASKTFTERLESFTETRDVNDNYDKGKAQLDIRLLPEGRALGLTPQDVGTQVRDAFFGALAMRQLRGTNEIEVRVKLPEDEREDLHFFRDFVVRTPDGVEVPLLDVATVSRTEAFNSITRRNGRRVITVSCDVEPKSAVTRVIEALQQEELPSLRAEHPGLTWSFEGTNAEMRESTRALYGGFALALIVIYTLLAIAFRSYTQPLIVLGVIPFGVIGAVIGHILLDYDLSLMSLMGIVALAGVVVNDSLIMIDHANRHRGEESAFDAIKQAGVRRFRPIILTTLTTFGGLTPIILETSNQANHLIPMAISLGFGIVFATGLILLLVPCLYLIFEDIAGALGAAGPGEDSDGPVPAE
jgi:multidrug efflux pump subunit AcrB